jgi:hypothetical protein
VPPTTYKVEGGKVFVFSKLVSLVSSFGLAKDESADPEQVARLLPQAWVEPQFAVESLGVVPAPYKLVETDGLHTVVHAPFNATLPGVFLTKSDAQLALVTLLMGGVVPGQGQFEYKGQPMTLCHTYDVETFPPLPDLFPLDNGELEGVDGAQYAEISALWERWEGVADKMKETATSRLAELWQRAAEYPFASLNRPGAKVPSYGQENLDELRSAYPNLTTLTDGSLYDRYETFLINHWGRRTDGPSTVDDFLFHLLGEVAVGPTIRGDRTLTAGAMAGYALLQGHSLEGALTFGAQCAQYQGAIRTMFNHAWTTTQFLSKPPASDALTGPAVVTMADLRIPAVVPDTELPRPLVPRDARD